MKISKTRSIFFLIPGGITSTPSEISFETIFEISFKSLGCISISIILDPHSFEQSRYDNIYR